MNDTEKELGFLGRVAVHIVILIKFINHTIT